MVNSRSADWHPVGQSVELPIESEKAAELRGLRSQAGSLLHRLEAGRVFSERREVESGRRDPLKFITGRSALESAIAATQGMIQRLDEVLAEFDAEQRDAVRAHARAARPSQPPQLPQVQSHLHERTLATLGYRR